MTRTAYGVDYDRLAERYDANPYRVKEPDPELVAFLRERVGRGVGGVAVLDIGCGTGNQLVADLSIVPNGTLVGLDPFDGMLRVARRKARAIAWVRGDGQCLPFGGGRFDFATNQFSYHHMADPAALFREAFRVLRGGGRLVVTNIAPREIRDAQLYRWFPEALEADLQAHPAVEALEAFAVEAGFRSVRADVRRSEWETNLAALAEYFGRKTDCSQLNALAPEVYARRLAALRAAAAVGGGTVRDVAAVVTLRADRAGATGAR